ncbi:thyroid hormone-inducible hepatic protein [Neosynchiropus ocellatus]
MQSADARFHRKSLLLALKRYGAAISHMEQTVLLPSLLRDIPSDDTGDSESAAESDRDLYDTFLMLKAVRNTVENGLVPPDDRVSKSSVLAKTLESLLDSDPELVFRFHLRGLFAVMSALTEKTQSLTDRYMDIIGFSK